MNIINKNKFACHRYYNHILTKNELHQEYWRVQNKFFEIDNSIKRIRRAIVRTTMNKIRKRGIY